MRMERVEFEKGYEEIITKGHWKTFVSNKHVNFHEFNGCSLKMYTLHMPIVCQL